MSDLLPLVIASLNPETASVAKLLIGKISEAVEGVATPIQIRRIARAEADASIIRAEGDAKIEMIRAKGELEVRAVQRLVNEEARRQQNMESVTSKAIPDLNATAKPTEMDDDWVANFFEKSRNVSNFQMQALWAKVLAGEANAPGSFSKRTINFLSGVDKADAERFATLCSFAGGEGNVIPLIFDIRDSIYMDNGLYYLDILNLQSIGLLIYNTEPAGAIEAKDSSAIKYFDRGILLKTKGRNLNLGRVILTEIGQQLAPISNAKKVEGFFEYLLNRFQQFSPQEIPGKY